jgi:DNA replication protein DnaC
LSDEYERKSSELVLADNLRIHVYPLLLVRDDALFLYRRTLASGYEYYSTVLDKTHIEPTKKKFSQSLFQVGSKQELFWTDVLPKRNPINGIRANIPEEGPYEFIGRRRQINQIKEEVITIVNENGILYGPGGIGKTALMIQLSKELFEEKDKENVPYENIIWVSAKSNFYDYIFDTIEEREPQVKSLDSILFAILRFFEFEDLEEYGFEDRKELTLELLQDFKVLLIVDNFETVPRGEADKIIDFFDTQVKKALRRKPENFKIILTSRELIPSGFRQIELRGLDMRDSKRLINSLFKRYRSTHSELTNEQKEALFEHTKGIPILIKHCFAKIYEYNEPYDSAIRSLPRYSGNIVQFSFREILHQLEKESDRIALQILILLEIVDIPLMIRQIADILKIEELCIEEKIPMLANFECIRRINQDNQEKYTLNDEIRLLTKSLIQEHHDLVREIRKKYFRNFSFDKRMDYTSEEEEILGIFEGYVKNRGFTDAEDFIKKELKKRPNSVLLNYYYARYLKDRRNEIDQAIKIFEELRKITHNHPAVLKLLFLCYASLSIPKFESADNLINQIQADLGEYLEQDLDLQLEIARFYVRWSVSIKLTKGIDPFEENLRQARYKELAKKALDILIPLENQLKQRGSVFESENIKLDEVYYRMSQCHYNLWDYDQALRMINKAITLASQSSNTISTGEYESFKNSIISTRDFYSRNPWIDRRQSRNRAETLC